MRILRAAALALAMIVPSAACGSARQPDATLFLSRTEASALARASTLGAVIFAHDDATAAAFDAVFALTRSVDTRVEGWTTRERDGVIEVYLMGGDTTTPELLYVVRVGPDRKAAVERLDPPGPVDADVAAMFRARSLVVGDRDGLIRTAGSLPCASAYNTVTLPASLIGEPGWLVYLLAATSDSGKQIIAGHHRVHVSADGAAVLGVQPLSRGCLYNEKGDPRIVTTSMWVTHDPTLSRVPFESHVFISLQARAPLSVRIDNETWLIDGATIHRIILPKN